MRKVAYLENALEGLVMELTEKIKEKQVGDRLSISAYYGNDTKLFRQSEIDGTVCKLFRETGTALEQLPGNVGSKIIFQIVSKEDFEKLFNIKESKPKAVKAKTTETNAGQADQTVQEQAETAQTVQEQAETAQTVQAETVQETKAEYTVSAFEQVKALLPALTEKEKQELLKLLQK